MTIKFHPNICNLMVGRGLLEGFAEKSIPPGGAPRKGTSVSVFSGVQPLAKNLIANWSSYNSNTNNLLAHYDDVEWWQSLEGRLLSLKVSTVVSTSLKTGLASWCVLWPEPVNTTALNTGTIPFTNFIIGPVTLNADSGIIRFENDLNIIEDTPKSIYDGSIGVNSY